MARLLPGLRTGAEDGGSLVSQQAELAAHPVCRSIEQLFDVRQHLSKDIQSYFRQWLLLPPFGIVKNPSWGRPSAVIKYAKETG